MHTVRVDLGPRAYDIALTHADPAGLGPFVRAALPDARLALVVADDNTLSLTSPVVASLQAVGFHTGTAVVPAGEGAKSLAELARLYDALYDLAADRRTAVVAVGGGVVGDLAGFAAATYNRGLPLVMVPTTLLAMVDSSVGGKTAVNHPKGKNLIGAFHQPAAVWIDTATLDTLPDREYRSGLAEVVKYGAALDEPFLQYLELHYPGLDLRVPEPLEYVVRRSCELKASVVERDEREETGLRAVLNYGHTFAHAFEAVAGYGTLTHGEAVAVGMVCASRLAAQLGRVSNDFTARQVRLLGELGLPTGPPSGLPTDELLAVMRRDKKATAAGLRFVLPTRPGHVELVGDIDERLVRDVLEGR